MILRLLVLCAAAALADPMAIYDQAIGARKDRNAQRFLQLTEQLLEYAPASPPLRFMHAEALAMSGRTEPALAELHWLATSGYDYAFWERDSFAGLPADETAALRTAMTKFGAPKGKIARIVRLDRDGLDAEGIDALGQDWIVGSMTNGSLYRVDRTGATTLLWQETEAGRRLFGVRYDPLRNLVWACSNGPDDRQARPQLLRIALKPLAVTRSAVPDSRALCNDIALLPDGTVAISDSERGAVRQLNGDGQWRTLAEPGSLGYPNGLTYVAEARRLVVADLRGLWAIDLEAPRLVGVEKPGTFIGGVDGLYAVNGGLVAIQNGLRPHRVLRIALDPGTTQVQRVTVLASNVPELAAMTTAAMNGGEITVLAGSQLVQLVSSGSADD
ncbi:MAG TPA: hypothetical protein VJT80_18105 [Steroidobacteraceae bacterium]|nr:hypothetical protein [Steroidobacteraceae bacterium]